MTALTLAVLAVAAGTIAEDSFDKFVVVAFMLGAMGALVLA